MVDIEKSSRKRRISYFYKIRN